MLVNWKIEYTDSVPDDKQPPDYYIKGEPYWFFRYFKDREIQVDVADISSFPALEKFEKNKLRFYVWQTIRVLPRLDEYDLVISHGMQSAIVLAFVRKLFGKGSYKHIVFDIGAFNSAKESGKALKFMQYAGRSIDGIIYHTPSQIDYYRKCHPWLVKKAVYIPFGTDTEFFEPDTINEEGIGKEDTGTDDRKDDSAIGTSGCILSVGADKRDYKTLIDAYVMGSRKLPLRIIGNKSAKAYTAQKYGHITDLDIIVSGKVDVNEYKEQIRYAAFCVLPLKAYNYSYGQMTMLQQMAMGRAVVVADVPSMKPYLDPEANIKYEPENVGELSGIMDRLSGSPGLCEQFGKRAKELVKDRFDEKSMALKIEETINFFMSDVINE